MNTIQYYCRYGEDNILDRLTGYLQQGFYIDVGAHSPFAESITKCFYDRGWSGMNIEPQINRYQELVIHRPRDINLHIACGAEDGTLELYLGDGLTTAKVEYSQPEWKKTVVRMKRLGDVCDFYIPGQEIAFLKIDVEGFEGEVIKGMSWDNFRPKVLCVESTVPNTTIDVSAEWEQILFDAGYRFEEKNPYNRFYIDTKL